MFSSAFRSPFQAPFLSSVVASGGVLFYDTFTDTNGTALTAHTPNIDRFGGGWKTWQGGSSNLQVQSNQASQNGTANCSNLANVNNATVRASVNFAYTNVGAASPGVVMRAFDNNSAVISVYWTATVRAAGPNQFRLSEYVPASFLEVVRASSTATTNDGTTRNISLEATGNNFTAKLTGFSDLTFTSSTGNTNTWAGLRGFNAGTAVYDNFLVESL